MVTLAFEYTGGGIRDEGEGEELYVVGAATRIQDELRDEGKEKSTHEAWDMPCVQDSLRQLCRYELQGYVQASMSDM